MDVATLVQELLDHAALDPRLIEGLPAEMAMTLVDQLHTNVEHYFYINANRSLEIARLIEQVGHIRNDQRIIGLGSMKRADSLRFLGELPGAWRAFGEAGTILLAAGDEVGWARTR